MAKVRFGTKICGRSLIDLVLELLWFGVVASHSSTIFLKVRFLLSPFGSRFEDPFNWIILRIHSDGYLSCAIQGIVFGYCYTRSAGPRHGLPNSGSVTRVTESQPPFLQSYLALVWRYLARVSRSARTAH